MLIHSSGDLCLVVFKRRGVSVDFGGSSASKAGLLTSCHPTSVAHSKHFYFITIFRDEKLDPTNRLSSGCTHYQVP